MDCELLEVFYHKGSFCNLEMSVREDFFCATLELVWSRTCY